MTTDTYFTFDLEETSTATDLTDGENFTPKQCLAANEDDLQKHDYLGYSESHDCKLESLGAVNENINSDAVRQNSIVYCKTPGKPEMKNQKLIDNRELRKRTKSFKVTSKGSSSMSVMMNDDSTYFNNAVVRETKAKEFRELTCVIMRSTHLIKSLPEVDVLQLESKKVTLGHSNVTCENGLREKKIKKTVIFDMDETLVHRVDDSDSSRSADIYVDVPNEDNSRIVKLGFNIRPYAIECLQKARKDFEVIVFTAGTKNYADSILNVLDPTKELIHHRLYRDSCIEVKTDDSTYYVKDLRILEDRELKNIVLVDNAVVSFAYQIDNGIPILPFYEDKEDTEFIVLMKLMDDINNAEDCREYVSRVFKIREIMNTDTDTYAYLYEISDENEDSVEEDPLDVILKCNEL